MKLDAQRKLLSPGTKEYQVKVAFSTVKALFMEVYLWLT